MNGYETLSLKTSWKIEHSCSIKGWTYRVNFHKFLVNAQVSIDCCYETPYIKHEVLLSDEHVEVWFRGMVGKTEFVIWVKVGLGDYKYRGIEKDPSRLGRFLILLDEDYE